MAPAGSTARRVTEELADVTGRSDEELEWMLAVTVAAGVAAGIGAVALRVLTLLDRIGINILPGALGK